MEGKSVVTLVLKTLEPTELVGWADFDLRENIFGNEYRPRLIVDYTTPSSPLDFTFLIMISIVIIAVVIIGGYAVMKKKRQPSLPSREMKY